ncbi:MAG: Peptide deformylase [Chlamydiae bacterium]|nr:Peptide deformylase [Chlamydiota bacterium]
MHLVISRNRMLIFSSVESMLKLLQLAIIGACFSMCAKNLHTLQFIPPDDPRLNQKSELVTLKEVKSQEIQTLISDMLRLSGCEADPEKYEKSGVLVGLAAPQVGIMKQIIIINTQSYEKIKKGSLPKFDVLINPCITWRSSKTEISREGCFSVPEKYLGCPKRSTEIKVQALDKNGNKISKKYSGSVASVVQHEVDHLAGIRFPQLLKSEKDLHILENETDISNYRKHWKNWDKHATAELWKQMKKGNYSNST